MRLFRRQDGQAVVEFAIAFPLQLLATLIILQLAFLYIASFVVQYGAYTAARAELVGADPLAAASAVCSPVAGITGLGTGSQPIKYPGWGNLDRSEIARDRTSVDLVMPLSAGENYVEAKVSCEVEMIFPVANKIVSWIPLMPEENYEEKIPGVYHVTIPATQRLPVPWRR